MRTRNESTYVCLFLTINIFEIEIELKLNTSYSPNIRIYSPRAGQYCPYEHAREGNISLPERDIFYTRAIIDLLHDKINKKLNEI